MVILLVEDEIRISNLVKKGLEIECFEVEVAADGEEALRLAKERRYDLILMDVMLPKLTGLEVTKHLREEEINTPIIMLTARDGAEERAMGFSVGANDYLVKPFLFQDLVDRIRLLLSQNKKTISNPIAI